jgi:hypothetical protein
MNVDPEKVVRASFEAQKGCPIKDFLTDQEIEEVVHAMADILVLTGVRLAEEEV